MGNWEFAPMKKLCSGMAVVGKARRNGDQAITVQKLIVVYLLMAVLWWWREGIRSGMRRLSWVWWVQ